MRSSLSCLVVTTAGVLLMAGCRGDGGPAGSRMRVRYTAEQNPTMAAGRGMPSLDSEMQPAAWILIDGKEGGFRTSEKTGRPLLEWFIEEPVSSTPTFTLAVFRPLLGDDVDANFVLEQTSTVDESAAPARYALAGREGVFEAGRTYSLSEPEEALIVRNLADGQIVESIGPLPPGEYLLAGSIRYNELGNTVLAATKFRVGS